MVEVPPPNPEDDSFSDSSVTTDEEPPLSPAKKNIHLRRWKLVSKGDGTFVIEGGKRPKEISWGPRDKLFGEGEEHLFNADFVLERLHLHRKHGRNGHVSTSICHQGYVSRTLPMMRADFVHYQDLWLKSPAHASLRATMLALKRAQQPRHVPVDNVACLALGSLQDMMEESRGRSLTQLAVLMTIMEVLDLTPTTPPTFTAQDPDFTPLDAAFLATLGLAVLPDPEGFLAITHSTLVYSIGGYLDMHWVVSRGAWPAAMVCGDVEAFMERVDGIRGAFRGLTEGERGGILAMLEGCDVASLVPGDDGGLKGWDNGGQQKVYWRREGRVGGE